MAEAWTPQHEMLFVHACQEMAAWERVPDRHLIERLLDRRYRRRRWLVSHLGRIAQITRLSEHTGEHIGGTVLWEEIIVDRRGQPQLVRIALNPRTNAIVNAFPLGFAHDSRHRHR